ncbi:MAG: spore cortex biosynthesis protein YabQ [Eubacterium sp.]
MIDYLQFLGLGFVFGFSFYLVTFLNRLFGIKWLSFINDALLPVVWALAAFSAIIVINNGNIRCQYYIMIGVGIFLYSVSIHKLLNPFINKIFSKISHRPNILKSFKKVLHLK